MKIRWKHLNRHGGLALLLLAIPLHFWMQSSIDRTDPVTVLLGAGDNLPAGELGFMLAFVAVRLLVLLLLPGILAATITDAFARRLLTPSETAPEGMVHEADSQ